MSNKEDIEPLNGKGDLHGLCIYYYDNGNVMYKRRYVNGIIHGLHEYYSSDRVLSVKDYYNNGEEVYRELYVWLNKIEFKI